mgnify:CR=1 FL=1
MALLDFLKNKEEKDKANDKKAVRILDTPKPKKVAKTEKVEKEAKPAKSGKSTAFSYVMVKEPHISEKSNYLGAENKYVFKVYENSNKPEIKKSVEGIYGVNVLSVNIIKIPGKKRRIGKVEGFKKGYTKAIVTIKEGQKIEIF